MTGSLGTWIIMTVVEKKEGRGWGGGGGGGEREVGYSCLVLKYSTFTIICDFMNPHPS